MKGLGKVAAVAGASLAIAAAATVALAKLAAPEPKSKPAVAHKTVRRRKPRRQARARQVQRT